MAPDLNAVAAGGEKWDYSKPGSSGYEVKQNLTWMDPDNRKLRVLTVGAGVSGTVCRALKAAPISKTDAILTAIFSRHPYGVPDPEALCERGTCDLREE